MLHRVFNLLTALSLLLCVTVVAQWIRGYFVTDRFFWQAFEDESNRTYWRQDMVKSGRGGVGMNRIIQSGDSPNYRAAMESFGRVPFHAAQAPEYPMFNVGVGDVPRWGGFKYGRFAHPDPQRPRPRAYAWQVVVPYWSILVVTAALPLAWIARWRRRRRQRRAGCCLHCGYDMRATPERCPECGKQMQNAE